MQELCQVGIFFSLDAQWGGGALIHSHCQELLFPHLTLQQVLLYSNHHDFAYVTLVWLSSQTYLHNEGKLSLIWSLAMAEATLSIDQFHVLPNWPLWATAVLLWQSNLVMIFYVFQVLFSAGPYSPNFGLGFGSENEENLQINLNEMHVVSGMEPPHSLFHGYKPFHWVDIEICSVWTFQFL